MSFACDCDDDVPMPFPLAARAGRACAKRTGSRNTGTRVSRRQPAELNPFNRSYLTAEERPRCTRSSANGRPTPATSKQLLDLAFGPNRLGQGLLPVSRRRGPGLGVELDRPRRRAPGRHPPLLARSWSARRRPPALLLGPLAVDPTLPRRGHRPHAGGAHDRSGHAGAATGWCCWSPTPATTSSSAASRRRPSASACPRKKPERLWVRPLAPGALAGVSGVIKPWRSVRGRGVSRRWPRAAVARRAA